MSHQRDTAIHLVAGGVAGTAGAVVTCPLEVVKTRLQSSQGLGIPPPPPPPSDSTANARKVCSKVHRHQEAKWGYRRTMGAMFAYSKQADRMLMHIVQNEGPKALFKGLGPNIVGVAPSRAIYFCTYSQAKAILNQNIAPDTPIVHLSAASAAEHLHVTCLNVRTLLQDSRISELCYAIKDLNWDIIGLSETRRATETIEEYEDFILYHSKGSNERNGVGFLIRKSWKRYIVSLNSFSDRVAVLEIKIYQNTLWTIIQIYAPTESYKAEDLDLFYQAVEEALDSTNTKNLILMGDFNAQIGKMRDGEERIFGKYSTGKRSKNRQKLIRLLSRKKPHYYQ
ncbi:Endonuclease-reverse transcriptase [Operophtera brumata]|uniref:Endonuclease-reverse transcriptase n=1 Tax=Operophtera brumata TaxID=104452 RepID=A0A0L7LQS2_OPEBR|nr:Endonuclease-reverse transcriptase [Operophtera brumata]